MNRNERRHARKTFPTPDGSGPREFLMEPDFSLDMEAGMRKLIMPRPVTELSFLIDGEIRKFVSIRLEGKPIDPTLNELAYAVASSNLQHYFKMPETMTDVHWTFIDLHEREAFFSGHTKLAGALWAAKAPMIGSKPVSMEKLQSFVPSYALIKGMRFMRLRDCLDLLAYAYSNSKIAGTLMS